MTLGVNPKRTCVRCGADVHMSATEQPHLCADLARRLARREKQRDAIVDLFHEWGDGAGGDYPVLLAEAIVAKLAGMGVHDD